MKIAVEGCAHGELEKIYDSIQFFEEHEGIKVDLLICCGDFQSTRNAQDLRCMAVPIKYQKMCSFYKYYSGEKIAPILTIFIGGNHEASNYLQELPYGGWVAPNIYYMGYASVVNVAGIRIGGISGIYKGHDYMKGHFEKAPYTEETKRSVYHIRNLEVFRLKQIKKPIDIMISHDWPRGIYNYGNVGKLLKMKPFLKDDIQADKLGSKPCEELLQILKPKFWFSAHLHVKFAAVVYHVHEEDKKTHTRFLSLDKCLPKRKFLQIIDIPSDTSKTIQLDYDLEWLTIVHLTNHLLSTKRGITYMPGQTNHERWIFSPTIEEQTLVLNRFNNDLQIPLNFSKTATPFDGKIHTSVKDSQAKAQLNPQTELFCERLGVDDPMALVLEQMSNDSTLSVMSVPSFLTPDKSENLSQWSSVTDDSSSQNQSNDIDSLNVSLSDTSSPSPMKRSSLNMPAPKLNTYVEDLTVSSILSKDEKILESLPTECLFLSSPSSKLLENENQHPLTQKSKSPNSDKESTMEMQCDQGVTPTVKKFKRRNQALYTKNDDDEV